MGDIKEKVIDLFDIYFDIVESKYEVSNEQIQYLKDKIKEDTERVVFSKRD